MFLQLAQKSLVQGALKGSRGSQWPWAGAGTGHTRATSSVWRGGHKPCSSSGKHGRNDSCTGLYSDKKGNLCRDPWEVWEGAGAMLN